MARTPKPSTETLARYGLSKEETVKRPRGRPRKTAPVYTAPAADSRILNEVAEENAAAAESVAETLSAEGPEEDIERFPEIKPPTLVTMRLVLVGDSPLIVHAWSEKARKEILDKQMKKPREAREAKDPERDFMDALYKIEGEDNAYGFPSVAFKNSAVTACTSLGRAIPKTAARQAFRVVGEQCYTRAAYDGRLMRHDLVRVYGSEPQMREDMVRVTNITDIRYRPEFWPWHVIITIIYNAHVLSKGQIANLFNIAGCSVGVGEWRMEKNGQFGLFHVASAQEARALGIELEG